MESKFELLEIGMKIDICKNEDDENSTYYPSQVLDMIEPDELIISGPIKKSDIVLLHKDEEIKVFYNIENKGKFYFIGKILSRDYSRIYTLRVKIISSTRKIQLRNYFRLPVSITVEKKIEVPNDKNRKIITEICVAKDISGGGMKLYCNYEHKVGDEIQWELKINNTILEGRAKVLRIEKIDTTNYKYSMGVSFTEITEYNRDIIVKYIFEQQRILRLKGLI